MVQLLHAEAVSSDAVGWDDLAAAAEFIGFNSVKTRKL
jgi:hypothetical protein